MAQEADYIQEELYRDSNFIHDRNTKILYYDCTNYYFETEEESGDRKYGKSKEHRPNPIVTMGLFMDADGLPLAFDIYPGNQNEQLTLRPLENKVIRDFDCSEFIFCSDAGLGSVRNRFLNSFGNRSYVITHSLKKMKKEDREIVLKPTQFRLPGSDKMIDLRTLDETDENVFDSVYYKEIPIVTGDMDETLIVTYSPKYKNYQRKIRARQIERAEKMIESGKNRRGKNPNDPARFIRKTSVTGDGEIAEKAIYELDPKRIREEEMYDGFYAVITNLEDDPAEVIKINRRRWEIEENFRIMKSEFEARPVYVQRDDRIKAHFLTCYISLLVYLSLIHIWKETAKILLLHLTLPFLLFPLQMFRIVVYGFQDEILPLRCLDALREHLFDLRCADGELFLLVRLFFLHDGIDGLICKFFLSQKGSHTPCLRIGRGALLHLYGIEERLLDILRKIGDIHCRSQ